MSEEKPYADLDPKSEVEPEGEFKLPEPAQLPPFETLVEPGFASSPLMTSARTESGSDNYGTPPWLYGFLDENFGPFTVDVCANAENAKTPTFYDEATDGLKQVWTGIFWCNPPYSDLKAWLKKGHDSVYVDGTAERGVFLIPSRTDTEAWHEYASKGLVFMLRSRLTFVQTEEQLKASADKWFAKRRKTPTDAELSKKIEEIRRQPAPFPSAVIVFDKRLKGPEHQALPFGSPVSAYLVHWTEKNTKGEAK